MVCEPLFKRFINGLIFAYSEFNRQWGIIHFQKELGPHSGKELVQQKHQQHVSSITFNESLQDEFFPNALKICTNVRN